MKKFLYLYLSVVFFSFPVNAMQHPEYEDMRARIRKNVADMQERIAPFRVPEVQEPEYEDMGARIRKNVADIREQALMSAAEDGLVKLVAQLLNTGVDVNTKNGNGDTALMIAAGKGHINVVQALLNAGADFTLKNNKGKTVLDVAERNAHALLINAQKNLNTIQDSFWKAIKAGDTDALAIGSALGKKLQVLPRIHRLKIINSRDENGDTALHYAVDHEDEALIRALLGRGADPEIKNNKERSAIDLARGHRPSMKILAEAGSKKGEIWPIEKKE